MVIKGKYEGANNKSLPSHSESQLLKYINFNSVIATMMKNIIVYFSITTGSKVTGFEDGSITIRFLSQWPLV